MLKQPQLQCSRNGNVQIKMYDRDTTAELLLFILPVLSLCKIKPHRSGKQLQSGMC